MKTKWENRLALPLLACLTLVIGWTLSLCLHLASTSELQSLYLPLCNALDCLFSPVKALPSLLEVQWRPWWPFPLMWNWRVSKGLNLSAPSYTALLSWARKSWLGMTQVIQPRVQFCAWQASHLVANSLGLDHTQPWPPNAFVSSSASCAQHQYFQKLSIYKYSPAHNGGHGLLIRVIRVEDDLVLLTPQKLLNVPLQCCSIFFSCCPSWSRLLHWTATNCHLESASKGLNLAAPLSLGRRSRPAALYCHRGRGESNNLWQSVPFLTRVISSQEIITDTTDDTALPH